jgi:hypothetical protein
MGYFRQYKHVHSDSRHLLNIRGIVGLSIRSHDLLTASQARRHCSPLSWPPKLATPAHGTLYFFKLVLPSFLFACVAFAVRVALPFRSTLLTHFQISLLAPYLSLIQCPIMLNAEISAAF